MFIQATANFDKDQYNTSYNKMFAQDILSTTGDVTPDEYTFTEDECVELQVCLLYVII